MVNSEASVQATHETEIARILSSLEAGKQSTKSALAIPFTPLTASLKSYFSVPFAVNYTGKSYQGVPYEHADGPALQLLSHLMTNHFLHREIREKGGAYGGRASYNALSGMLEMMSYRDPEVARTLDTYEAVVDWSLKMGGIIGKSELDEAKLNIFQVRFFA